MDYLFHQGKMSQEGFLKLTDIGRKGIAGGL